MSLDLIANSQGLCQQAKCKPTCDFPAPTRKERFRFHQQPTALREDRHTEDPPFQVQGVGTYRGAREEEQLRQEGEERLTSSLPHKPKKRSAPLCWPLLKL